MEYKIAPCPICGNDAKTKTLQPTDVFRCERCGTFSIPIRFLFMGEDPYKDFHDIFKDIPPHLLSGFVRDYSERNRNYYHFTCDTNEVESINKRVPYDNDVLEKAKILLLAIERITRHPGESIELILGQDYPLAYCQNEEELNFYLQHLIDTGLIRENGGESTVWRGFISVDGWRAIASYKVPNAESEKVFVAMWFDPQMDDAYENGFKAAIEDEDIGYKSIRIDKKEFLGKVDDEIIAEIRESRFIVADFTEQRNGVYFEAGFAYGLGLKVIYTCRKDYVDKLHFDTRQENHIIWDTTEDLREKLKNRIRAEIGLGPHKGK